MTEGLASFADAVSAAKTELGFGEPDAPAPATEGASPAPEASEVEEVLGSDGDQAGLTTDEQPEAAEPELFDDEFIGEVIPEDEGSDAPAAVELTDETLVEVPQLQESVTLKELREGYMRQADYTRKTQELSTQRSEATDAVKFWDALQDNPLPIVRNLAARVGLIPSEDVEPVGEGDVSPLKSQAQIEAEVAKRVEQELAKHPDMQEARMMKAQRVIDAEFDRIAADNNVPLGPKSREAILAEARRTGATDLEMVFHALVARQNKRASNVSNIKAVSPTSPRQGRPDGQQDATEGEVVDFTTAAQRALAEVGAS